jgi:hypothetical protein
VRIDDVPRPRLEHCLAQLLDVFHDIAGAQKPIVFLAAIDRALRHSARVEVHDVVFFLQQPQSRRPILGVDDGARPARDIKDVPPLLLIQVKPVAEKICELKLAARWRFFAAKVRRKSFVVRKQSQLEIRPFGVSGIAHFFDRPRIGGTLRGQLRRGHQDPGETEN